ncbi:FliO/MopB family protein [Petropleomorpha daqingensis]|uniref:Flagellar protein FliO/FliZ n=1 Tax=Petropleomorpha daqingensis TaxID=2026353 RepID=A0A853CEP2_9ACTN|nr:flagellar biosynthetic protein FliO [Petropleomorpha daqingensis]NYJ06320.1 flagellar protein FliO/FliZ [Petropleomorpha daqingensis]
MTWMVIRLVLSLAFVGGVLWFAARLAKKRGLGGNGNGLIEVVARQRMGRASTVNVVRIGDVCLVVGATEEQVTLLAEVDPETVEAAVRTKQAPRALTPVHEDDDAGYEPVPRPRVTARTSSGALNGSVFDKKGWGSFMTELREKTVRRS